MEDNNTDYQTVELSQEEMADVTRDLQEVLARHDCELQVISNIHILKRQAVEKPTSVDVLPSPYDGEPNNEEPDATPEEGGESASR